jgi:Zn finger protein HypA/HybF involved in hydrogenase expression
MSTEQMATPSSRWAADGLPDPHGDRYDCERAALALGHLTDDELANAVYLHGNEQPSMADLVAGKALSGIVYLTAAKERIRWLSRALAATGKQQVGEKCLTCSDRGWVGGPTFSDPAEGGMQCPDCNALDAHMERYEQQVGGVHPDDAAVDAFAAAMKAKMADARAKGRGGWEDPAQCSALDLCRLLRDHVEKGDPRDVANFCMMLWNRQEGIATHVGKVQGDALLATVRRLRQCLAKAAFATGTDRHSADELVSDLADALAARQPGAQEPVGTVSYYSPMNFGGFMIQFKSPTPIEPGTKIYAAPPAQAVCSNCDGAGVIPYTFGQTPEQFEQGEYPCPECTPAQGIDLGQFRRPVEEWRADMERWVDVHGDAQGAFARDIAEADRLLALIDGRDAGTGVGNVSQPNEPGRTLYVDLDGVMADFDGAFPAVFGLDHRSLADEEMWGHINSHASFFRDLPPMAGAIEFFRSIEHLSPVILTACPKSNYAHVAAQKRAWVREHLSQTCLVLPVMGGRHKPLFMHQPGDVLIDDWGKNCAAWTEAGGVAIKHESDWDQTRAALSAAGVSHD